MRKVSYETADALNKAYYLEFCVKNSYLRVQGDFMWQNINILQTICIS